MRFSLLLADVDNTLFNFHSAERAAFAAVSARFSLPPGEASFALYQEINKRLKNISESDKLACKTVRLLPFGNDGESVIRRVVKHGTSCFGLCRRIFSTGA